MYIAIPKDETKPVSVFRDEESLRIYEMREKALYDWTSGVNHAKKEGRDEIIGLLKSGKTPEEIIRDYGSQ